MKSLKEIKGGSSTNKLGTISFVNDFNFNGIKRFYSINLPKKKIIRAFHGHFKEDKAVFVSKGKVLLCIVKLDDKSKPNKKNRVKKIILSENDPKVVYIPKGHANGIMSLEKNSNVLFFSNLSLKNSIKDDYRFPFDYWGKDIWK